MGFHSKEVRDFRTPLTGNDLGTPKPFPPRLSVFISVRVSLQLVFQYTEFIVNFQDRFEVIDEMVHQKQISSLFPTASIQLSPELDQTEDMRDNVVSSSFVFGSGHVLVGCQTVQENRLCETARGYGLSFLCLLFSNPKPFLLLLRILDWSHFSVKLKG